MGVYIKGMDMPKSCWECPFVEVIHKWEAVESGVYCRGKLKDKDPEESEWWDKRYDDCPLIDIDLVRCGECEWWEKMKDSYFGYCHAEKHCHFSNNWEISIYRTYKRDHFCSYGERRADDNTIKANK